MTGILLEMAVLNMQRRENFRGWPLILVFSKYKEKNT